MVVINSFNFGQNLITFLYVIFSFLTVKHQKTLSEIIKTIPFLCVTQV